MKNIITILAAGKGSRMDSDLPKVLVPLLGKPLLLRLLETIKTSNYKDEAVYLIVSPENKDLIAEAVQDFNVKFIIQKEALGTGHAVQSLVEEFSKQNIIADNLIVLYGDHPLISVRTINRLLDVQLEKSQPLHLLTTQRLCGFADLFEHWGRILRDENGKIVGIREYKDATVEEKEILEVNPAFMTFDYKWLAENLLLLQNDNKAKEYYLTDLVKIAQKQNCEILSGGVMPEEAIGVNTKEELEKATNILEGDNLACPFS